MGEKSSLMFADGSFVEIPDNYINIAKSIAAKAKMLVAPAVFVQFGTKKEERIAYNLYRVFCIEEYEDGTIFVFDDGTRLEVQEEYTVVMERIAEKIDKVLGNVGKFRYVGGIYYIFAWYHLVCCNVFL